MINYGLLSTGAGLTGMEHTTVAMHNHGTDHEKAYYLPANTNTPAEKKPKKLSKTINNITAMFLLWRG